MDINVIFRKVFKSLVDKIVNRTLLLQLKSKKREFGGGVTMSSKMVVLERESLTSL